MSIPLHIDAHFRRQAPRARPPGTGRKARGSAAPFPQTRNPALALPHAGARACPAPPAGWPGRPHRAPARAHRAQARSAAAPSGLRRRTGASASAGCADSASILRLRGCPPATPPCGRHASPSATGPRSRTAARRTLPPPWPAGAQAWPVPPPPAYIAVQRPARPAPPPAYSQSSPPAHAGSWPRAHPQRSRRDTPPRGAARAAAWQTRAAAGPCSIPPQEWNWAAPAAPHRARQAVPAPAAAPPGTRRRPQAPASAAAQAPETAAFAP